ncbi:TPA: colicin lysis protein [Streptococcus suis]
MKACIRKLLLMSTVVLLVACQSNQAKGGDSPNSSASSQVSASSSLQQSSATVSSPETQTSSVTTPKLSGVYQPVIKRYQANLVQAAEVLNQDEVSSYLSLLTSQGQEYSGLFYSLSDINHDGAEELLLALDKSGEYVLIDLYTQLSGESLRLIDNFRNTGLEIGPDAQLYPLQDGTYLFEGNGVYRIYQYNAMIPGLKKVSDYDSRPETVALLDLTSLTWTKLEK